MMPDLEGIWTDPRLACDSVEAHLDSLSDDAYLFDEYHAVASGGSSRTRGIFVYGWDAWAIGNLTFARFRRRRMQSDPQIGLHAPAVMIAGGKATHMTFAMARAFGVISKNTPIPASLPVAEIVSRLNELQPVVLAGLSVDAVHTRK
jgi:phenylacetate-CoA ligase